MLTIGSPASRSAASSLFVTQPFPLPSIPLTPTSNAREGERRRRSFRISSVVPSTSSIRASNPSAVGENACSHLGDVLVLLRRIATHADGSDDLSPVDDRDPALERCGTRKPERRDPAIPDLVLEDLARSPE